jgi:hypothetical protein
MTRDEYLERFASKLIIMQELTKAKNHDYGGNDDPWKNFRTFGKKGILVRMSDKFARLHTAIWEERAFKVQETLIDTIIDLAVYCIILAIWIESENA